MVLAPPLDQGMMCPNERSRRVPQSTHCPPSRAQTALFTALGMTRVGGVNGAGMVCSSGRWGVGGSGGRHGRGGGSGGCMSDPTQYRAPSTPMGVPTMSPIVVQSDASMLAFPFLYDGGELFHFVDGES